MCLIRNAVIAIIWYTQGGVWVKEIGSKKDATYKLV